MRPMRAFAPLRDEKVEQKEQTQLIEIFCTTGPLYVEALKLALKQDDNRHSVRFAHTLRETLDCLKVESLSKIAQSLETLIANRETNEAQFLLRRLESLLAELQQSKA